MAVKCTTFPDPRLEREESGVVLCAAEPCCVLPRLDGRHPQGTRGQGQGCSVFPICLLSRSSVRICLESPSESRGLAPALGKPLRLVGDQPGSHRCAQTQVTTQRECWCGQRGLASLGGQRPVGLGEERVGGVVVSGEGLSRRTLSRGHHDHAKPTWERA